jgi:hypothetical protein
MTDIELLELAAKAAGLPWDQWVIDGNDSWNPLNDSGDAFELAVWLSLHTGRSATGPMRFAGRNDFEIPGCSFYEFENGDSCAALRRAIVRAAAEIGKAMP